MWGKLTILLAIFLSLSLAGVVGAAGKGENTYVGAQKCKECHEEIYQSYAKSSQKAHSFKSVKVMMPKLTPGEVKECYACHTTGYGKPGGFVSLKETPQMANAGCEVCHGPGSKHVKTESADDIKGKLTVKDCAHCHNQERIGAFRYKPLIYGGGH